MNVNWFKNPNHVVYAPIDEFAENFGKEVGISNLREELVDFRTAPTYGGRSLKGRRRTTLKLIIPNMIFNEKIEMGNNVWVYLGENYPSYCVYWPDEGFDQTAV